MIAVTAWREREAMNQLRALPRGFANSRTGDAILEAVKTGLAMDHASLPAPDNGRDDLSDQAQAATEILKLALKVVCESEGIAPKLVANSADIEAIATDDNADIPLMHGWRREVFGHLALEIKHGRAFIGLHNGKVRLLSADEALKSAAE